MHRILINKELCTGCKSCVLACMLKHSENSNMYTLNLNDIDNDSRGHIELDKDNKPVQVPEVYPESEDEIWLNRTGEQRAANRKKHVKQTKELMNFFSTKLYI